MKSAAKTYKTQAVKNATPTELISILYDLVIEASYKKDSQRVYDLFTTLIHGLNFDYEIAADLYNIYDYCQRLAKQEKFDEIIELISGIRESWNEAVVNNENKSKGSLNIKG